MLISYNYYIMMILLILLKVLYMFLIKSIEKLGHLNSSSIVDNLAYGYRLDNRHLISPIEQTMVNLNDNDFTSSDFYPSFCNDIYNNDLTELTKMMYGLPIDTKSFIKINYSNMLSTPAIKIKEYINDK